MTYRDRDRRPGRLLRAGIGAAVVCGLALAVPTVWVRAESRGRVLTAEEAPARDVAVIFGAEMYSSGQPSPYLQARLDLGVRLWTEQKAAVLVVSGDNADDHHAETTNMRRYLEDHGVPQAAIVEDEYGRDTYDTCVRLRAVFGVSQALLVSQRYHLPRAVATCRAVGVDAVGVGDVSVKQTSKRWNEFAAREIPASVKMVLDLVSRREPSLAGDSEAVTVALGG
ncbi:MAG: vancomycin high temperature exclusion protein [Propioniciclava sp.]